MSDIDTPAPPADPAPADTPADTDVSETSTQEDKAPEATQDKVEAKEAEAPETKAEDTVEEKLYAGKYKTAEEMEKAYKELNSKFSQTSSEKAELSRILNEAFVPPAPADTENDYSEESSTTQDNSVQRDVSVMKFMLAHGNADGEAMKKVLESDPLVKQMSGYDAKLEYAYLRSQNMSQPKAIEEAQKTATEKAQAKVVEKQAAQVETAQKAEETDENSELYEKATGNYSQEERDQARLKLIRKNLVDI